MGPSVLKMTTVTAAEDRATAKLFDALLPLEDNGTNLSTWMFRQRQIFKARNLIGHIDGTVTKPSDPSELLKWEKNDDTACMQISMHVGEEVLQHIMDLSTAKEMWDAIIIKFGGDGPQSAAFLIQNICRKTENSKASAIHSTTISSRLCSVIPCHSHMRPLVLSSWIKKKLLSLLIE